MSLPALGEPPSTLVADQVERELRSSQHPECRPHRGDVYVRADGAEVTVTGQCQEIEVPSNGNVVQTEISIELDIYGSGNQVDSVEAREMDVYGNDNTITIASITEIDVYGNNNVVTFGSGNPQIDDEGIGNSITAG